MVDNHTTDDDNTSLDNTKYLIPVSMLWAEYLKTINSFDIFCIVERWLLHCNVECGTYNFDNYDFVRTYRARNVLEN